MQSCELISLAEAYLNADKLKNCSLLNVLHRGSANVINAGRQGVLLRDEISGVYMLSADFSPDTCSWLNELKNADVFQVIQPEFVSVISRILALEGTMECYQYVFQGSLPDKTGHALKISLPTESEMEIISQIYTRISQEELFRVWQRRDIFAGHDEKGNMVGFIGCHLEGSMGMLEVLPEYRRRGYAEELECYMIEARTRSGAIPYCHVEQNNIGSIALQQKLGLTMTQGRICWVY